MVLFVSLVSFLRLRYGGGEPFPNRSTMPVLSKSGLEIVATLEEPPGNIAVSNTGRIFITIHPESKPETIKVAEILNNKVQPFPDLKSQELFHAPQGIRIDRQGRLWTIDHADNGMGNPQLLAFDVKSGKLLHRYDFPESIAAFGSYLQDMVIDPDGKTVYIADVSFVRQSPALVIYDIDSKTARRVLEEDPSVMPQNYFIQTKHAGPMIRFGGVIVMKVGVDSIGIDNKGEWLYYGAMNHETMFRIRTKDLKNKNIDSVNLNKRKEVYGPKVLSDGISLDHEGNIYITDIENQAIAILDKNRKLKTLIQDKRMRWPDGLSFGPENWLYIADSDIPNIALRSKNHIKSKAPYYLFRFQPGKPGTPGQ